MSGGRIVHIVVAAGVGSRFGGDVPKQFLCLGGKPVAMHAIERLRRATPGAEMRLVVSEPMKGYWHELCAAHGFESPEVVAGGATRWESVRNALGSVDFGPEDIVTVHDAVRPLVSDEVVGRLCRAVADGADGAIPVVAMTDSLRLIDDAEGHSHAVDRSLYRGVQTPQAFAGQKLKEAYSRPYDPRFTDDASVMEAAGYGNLRLVEGDYRTVKITRPMDFALVELLLKSEGT